jgi:hypothetical protein
MLRSVAIRADWAEKQVELPPDQVFDWLETARTRDFELALISCADANIIDHLVGSAMFNDQVGAPVHGERVQLLDIWAVLNAAWFKGQVKIDRFALEIEDGEKHGGQRRERAAGTALSLQKYIVKFII